MLINFKLDIDKKPDERSLVRLLIMMPNNSLSLDDFFMLRKT